MGYPSLEFNHPQKGSGMTVADAISPSIEPVVAVRRALTTAEPAVLADAIASLAVETHWRWAWDNYRQVVRDLCRRLAARRLIEIGGGRDPLFNLAELKDLGAEL